MLKYEVRAALSTKPGSYLVLSFARRADRREIGAAMIAELGVIQIGMTAGWAIQSIPLVREFALIVMYRSLAVKAISANRCLDSTHAAA